MLIPATATIPSITSPINKKLGASSRFGVGLGVDVPGVVYGSGVISGSCVGVGDGDGDGVGVDDGVGVGLGKTGGRPQ